MGLPQLQKVLEMVQLWPVDKTVVLILGLPRPWVIKERGLERTSQGKRKTNSAGRGWLKRFTQEWGETRRKYCYHDALTTWLRMVVKTWSEVTCSTVGHMSRQLLLRPLRAASSYLKKGGAPRQHPHWPLLHKDLEQCGLMGQRCYCHE